MIYIYAVIGKLIIQNHNFLNENNLVHSIEWATVARITFVNCNFDKDHLHSRKTQKSSFKLFQFLSSR